MAKRYFLCPCCFSLNTLYGEDTYALRFKYDPDTHKGCNREAKQLVDQIFIDCFIYCSNCDWEIDHSDIYKSCQLILDYVVEIDDRSIVTFVSSHLQGLINVGDHLFDKLEELKKQKHKA